MVDANKAVTLVVGITVAALMASFLMPVVIGQLDGTEESVYTQEAGDTVELQPNMTATVDSVGGTEATYTINASGDTSTVTVAEDANSTVTVDGTDVTINPTDITTTEATTGYTYSGTYGWGGGAGALWVILPVLIVLALFLYFVAMSLDYV